MAEESGEPQITDEVAAQLLSFMMPGVEPEIIQLVLGEPQVARLRGLVELLTLIRDSGIDHAELDAILGLNQDTLTAGDGQPASEPG